MSKKVVEVNDSVSKSRQKREAQKNKAMLQRRQAKIGKTIGIVAVLAVVCLVAALIAIVVVNKLNQVKAVADATEFSNELDANGFVNGVVAKDIVSLPDISDISVPYSEIEYTEASIDNDIEGQLNAHQILSDDDSRAIADGDKVNIDYEGKIDGVAFEGGTYDNYDLTIGSGMFIEGFEDQLIGAKKGDEIVVNVTFPEDYSEEVAGKDAEFFVKVNGIYVNPEYNDDFVKEYLSEYASSADEYRQYLKETNETDNLNNWLDNYLSSGSTVTNYPKKYVKQLMKIQRYLDEQEFEYMNQYYSSLMGQAMYNSFADYIQMDENEYAKSLKDSAENTAKNNLSYQAVLELNNVKVDEQSYREYLKANGEDNFDSMANTYGNNYQIQQYVKIKALELLKDKVNIQ